MSDWVCGWQAVGPGEGEPPGTVGCTALPGNTPSLLSEMGGDVIIITSLLFGPFKWECLKKTREFMQFFYEPK